MINIIRASDLWMQPRLAATMFSDRRKQFRERLRWPVQVDLHGYERDTYDAENPIYIILEDNQGHHAGSMRLLPTLGKTMISDYFSETLNGQDITNERTWECTRFCIAPQQSHHLAFALLAVGARLMTEAKLNKLIAIFDQRMIRVYNRVGVRPEIIGSHVYPNGEVISGYWSFDQFRYLNLIKASGLDQAELEVVIANFKIPWMQREPSYL